MANVANLGTVFMVRALYVKKLVTGKQNRKVGVKERHDQTESKRKGKRKRAEVIKGKGGEKQGHYSHLWCLCVVGKRRGA